MLELYLNEIFLGENSHGVAAAASNYFGKSLDELTVIRSGASLRRCPKVLANYDPQKAQSGGYRAGCNYVLDQMADNGYLTRPQAAKPLMAEKTSSPARGPSARWRPTSITSSRKCDVSSTPNMASSRCMTAACRFVPRSTRTCSRSQCKSSALQRGLTIAYDRRHGYRGPLAKIDMKRDWKTAFAKVHGDKSGVR